MHSILIASLVLLTGFSEAQASQKSFELKKVNSTVMSLKTGLFQAAPPAPLEIPVCTEAFVTDYVAAANQINIIANYAKVGEMPPNVPEAFAACEKLEKTFPAHVCNVPAIGQSAKTEDFADLCKSVRELHGDGAKIPEPKDVSEATALSKVEAARLSMKVTNANELQRAASKPGLMFVIDGRIYDLPESLLVQTDIRCMVGPAGQGKATFTDGQALQAAKIDEGFKSGYRHTRVSFVGATFTLECVSQTGDGLSLGGFKKAFNGLLDIQFQN
jgi:hypothetical protein